VYRRTKKNFREGRKGYYPQVLFFGQLQAAWEIGEVFRMGSYGRHGNQWVEESGDATATGLLQQTCSVKFFGTVYVLKEVLPIPSFHNF